MLICPKHNFIFVHVPRTGGTSVMRALQGYTDPILRAKGGWYLPPGENGLPLQPRAPLWQRPLRAVGLGRLLPELDRPSMRKHIAARGIRDLIPAALWDRCFKFGFVRNPFDLIASWWYNARYKQGEENAIHQRAMRMSGFAEFVRWRAQYPNLLTGMLTDGEGQLLVDFVGRFEDLGADFAEVCRRIGIEAELPHLNAAPRGRDYREMYDEETRAIVEDRYAEDLKTFGYEF